MQWPLQPRKHFKLHLTEGHQWGEKQVCVHLPIWQHQSVYPLHGRQLQTSPPLSTFVMKNMQNRAHLNSIQPHPFHCSRGRFFTVFTWCHSHTYITKMLALDHQVLFHIFFVSPHTNPGFKIIFCLPQRWLFHRPCQKIFLMNTFISMSPLAKSYLQQYHLFCIYFCKTEQSRP